MTFASPTGSTNLASSYKHYLCYEEGIVKKKKDRPLYFGTDFHKLLEYRNKSDDEKSKAMQEIIDTYYSLPADQQSDLIWAAKVIISLQVVGISYV